MGLTVDWLVRKTEFFLIALLLFTSMKMPLSKFEDTSSKSKRAFFSLFPVAIRTRTISVRI